ncbi:hypothetical protein C1Y08_08385 [Pseudomonas sp. FW306-02-F02-AA]|uniref:Uncharacterized protein n=1 Tax=Pseudomonas fluorescens TaxID=294 RepID=A0A0N9VQQ5_PSEFL|nr:MULTISPECIES: hypothetical protein [Pseudomonas]ALI00503.1 hypothetical protein AO353_05320 [Pseudomonas fluorescens]PMZ03624.1 hypothetical protein C1Y07_13595 [Pseudomonas sp. FW306-02-F02-AB]PMZ09778.1 hypothetical protein C1Y06_12250 [Pseudomonas sp. FW306-02-H06C]PMZ16418.1 hypothetical protein C1Y08_08385 [Pseudomonas sp. FW306-02-F02-AA]PMZ22358.1 hypothetical protein C1Y09_08925 [Pseudomonas sp. FW306-02-F08-AA]
MTAQQKVLPAPTLEEAVDDILYVHKLKDAAHGVVPPNTGMKVGAIVVFKVQPSHGNAWSSERHVVTDPSKPITFAIPKHVFEKNLFPDATAILHYSVKDQSGNVVVSSVLTIKVEE